MDINILILNDIQHIKSWIQHKTSHPIPLRSVLILSPNICLGLLSDLSLSGFATKLLYPLQFFSRVLHVPPILNHRFYHCNNIWWRIGTTKMAGSKILKTVTMKRHCPLRCHSACSLFLVCFAYSTTLKVEAIRFSEMWASFHRTTWRLFAEHNTLLMKFIIMYFSPCLLLPLS
jgi:hypothetical protein